MLAQTEAAALLRGTESVHWCFCDGDSSVVVAQRFLILRRSDPDPAVAARAAHLLDHVVQGPPLRPTARGAGLDCEARVDAALGREAEAYALELRIRDALHAGPSEYEFEVAYRRDADVDAIATYLRAHPDGAPGLDGLASAYRRVCEAEVSRGSR